MSMFDISDLTRQVTGELRVAVLKSVEAKLALKQAEADEQAARGGLMVLAEVAVRAAKHNEQAAARIAEIEGNLAGMGSARDRTLHALDALGLALTNAGHIWTDEERRLYDAAMPAPEEPAEQPQPEG